MFILVIEIQPIASSFYQNIYCDRYCNIQSLIVYKLWFLHFVKKEKNKHGYSVESVHTIDVGINPNHNVMYIKMNKKKKNQVLTVLEYMNGI